MKMVVHGLVRKRRELTCRINALADELAALDTVLRSIHPGIDLDAIPPLRIVNRVQWAVEGRDNARRVFRPAKSERPDDNRRDSPAHRR